jgi:methylenetetrahydrofolate reductase (NADPH)
MNILPSIFHIDIPDALAEAVEKAKTPDQVREVGIEWAIQQCKELVDANVPCLHFYTMGNPEPCKRVAEKIF